MAVNQESLSQFRNLLLSGGREDPAVRKEAWVLYLENDGFREDEHRDPSDDEYINGILLRHIKGETVDTDTLIGLSVGVKWDFIKTRGNNRIIRLLGVEGIDDAIDAWNFLYTMVEDLNPRV